MSLIRGLLRLLAFLFNLVTGLFLLAVGGIGLLTGEEIHFPLVPGVAGETLKWTLVGLGLFALLSTFLALKSPRALRLFMVLWNLLVVGLLICAGVRSSYRFSDDAQIHFGLILFLVALLALWGAWAQMKRTRKSADNF